MEGLSCCTYVLVHDLNTWDTLSVCVIMFQQTNNQPLRTNYPNFNLGHRINIQGEARRGWEERFAKV